MSFKEKERQNMGAIVDSFVSLWGDTGLANFTYQNGIMIVVSFIFLYLAIRRGFEPLLLVPIAFELADDRHVHSRL